MTSSWQLAWAAFVRPFQLINGLRAHPEAWRRWLRTVGVQAGLTLVLGSLMLWWADEDELGGAWAVAALWVSNLVVVQTLVLAFTRDFQDRLSNELAVAHGLPAEDAFPERARLRLDFKWLRRNLRRRWRGVVMVGATVLVALPVVVVLVPLDLGGFALEYVVSAASVYWWVVFTAARSAWAWETEKDVSPAWPMSAWVEFAEKTSWARWCGMHLGARFLAWATKEMAAPAREVDANWPAFLGLGLARVVATVPVVKVAMRAAMVVAVGEVLKKKT